MNEAARIPAQTMSNSFFIIVFVLLSASATYAAAGMAATTANRRAAALATFARSLGRGGPQARIGQLLYQESQCHHGKHIQQVILGVFGVFGRIQPLPKLSFLCGRWNRRIIIIPANISTNLHMSGMSDPRLI